MTTDQLAQARTRCSEILGYVQAGQSDPVLYEMVLNLHTALNGNTFDLVQCPCGNEVYRAAGDDPTCSVCADRDQLAVDPNTGEIELAEGVLTIKLPGLTAVRFDTHRGLIAIDRVSGLADGTAEWTVRDLRHGVYGDFHLLRPADDCTYRECANQHTA